jgi:acetyl esterase/lipase
LFFIYGGGFNTGERSISPKTFGLVYACVGAFYARRGCIVVIPDYRLVPHVVFPGGAEDIRDAARWVTQNAENLISTGSPSPDTDRLVLMGHSAGAMHVSTALFSTNVIPENDELRSKIVAIILQSPPYDLSAITNEWPNADIHANYWGTLNEAKAKDPLHLYRSLPDSTIKVLPKILMVEGEWEPEWLIDAGMSFREEVKERTGEQLKKIVGRGHNHISLNWALSTGQGEEWAEEVVEWLHNIKG